MSARAYTLRMVERARGQANEVAIVILQKERGAAFGTEAAFRDRRRSVDGRWSAPLDFGAFCAHENRERSARRPAAHRAVAIAGSRWSRLKAVSSAATEA